MILHIDTGTIYTQQLEIEDEDVHMGLEEKLYDGTINKKGIITYDYPELANEYTEEVIAEEFTYIDKGVYIGRILFVEE